jgi:glycosyltransferase involved in cell wall biosynthesis
MRYVICTLGGDIDPWELPASSFSDRPWIHGGERGLYELAAAIAAIDGNVELRGDLSRPDLDEICAAADVRLQTDLPPRRPEPDDVVIVPEGWPEPMAYARIALSPARAILLLLAPPGLFGWPFVEGWSAPDPLTVAIEELARPEHFLAMRALGFTLWANSPGIVKAARAAGVPITFIGEGQPIPFPEIPSKTADVVFMRDNRWAPLAERVAERLAVGAEAIPASNHREVIRRVAAARILLLPSRVEGTSRLQWEARAVGTVPVALSTNPFAHGLQERGGAVVVDSVEQMPTAIEELLSQPGLIQELSDRAVQTARAQVDWAAYGSRVQAALDALPGDDPGLPARAEIGRRIEQLLRRRGEQARMSSAERDRAVRDLAAVKNRRSVRAALRLADSLRRVRRLAPRTPSPPRG